MLYMAYVLSWVTSSRTVRKECKPTKKQETRNRSGYRKSPLGEFIRICLKIEQNYRLFWDIFSTAIMNHLFMTFTSRLKVDAKCVLSAVKLDHSCELFLDTPS